MNRKERLHLEVQIRNAVRAVRSDLNEMSSINKDDQIHNLIKGAETLLSYAEQYSQTLINEDYRPI